MNVFPMGDIAYCTIDLSKIPGMRWTLLEKWGFVFIEKGTGIF